MKQLKQLMLIFLLAASVQGYAQEHKRISYSVNEIAKNLIPVLGTPQITAKSYKVFQMDIEALKSGLEGIGHREADLNQGFVANVLFPHPDGTMHEYRSVANSTMHPLLAAKYTMIKTYDASGDDGSFVKWDITQKGLHAMIMIPGESTIFIDPLFEVESRGYCHNIFFFGLLN